MGPAERETLKRRGGERTGERGVRGFRRGENAGVVDALKTQRPETQEERKRKSPLKDRPSEKKER